MKYAVLIFGLILTFALSGAAQTRPTGNWLGDSICQVENSPCKTERVVYRIIQMDEKGRFAVQMDKIINEQPEYMGTIEFQVDEANKSLTGKYRDTVWKFTLSGTEMEGTLTLADGTIYRKIRVAKIDCGAKNYD